MHRAHFSNFSLRRDKREIQPAFSRRFFTFLPPRIDHKFRYRRSGESLLPLLAQLHHTMVARAGGVPYPSHTRSLSRYLAPAGHDFSLNPPRPREKDSRSERDLVDDLRTIKPRELRVNAPLESGTDAPRRTPSRSSAARLARARERNGGAHVYRMRRDSIVASMRERGRHRGVGGCRMSCALLSGRHTIRIH